MAQMLKSKSPLTTPFGSPNQWYTPINTPQGTPHSGASNHITAAQIVDTHDDHSSSSHPSLSNSHLEDSQTNDMHEPDTEPIIANNSNSSKQLDSKSDLETEQGKKFTKIQWFTIIILAISSVCSAMFGSLIAPFFPMEAEKKGVSETWIGILFGSYQLVGFILSPIFGAYLTKIGGKFMYVAGIFVNSSCAILFGSLQWCPKGTIFLVMCFLSRSVEAVGAAAIGTASRAIAIYTFPQHVSTVTGILNACGCAGLMIGPPVGGVLYEAGGFFLPFLVTGSAFMVCAFISWCFLPSPDVRAVKEEKNAIPKWHLLKIPVISVIGYLVFVGQFGMGFLDVTFSLHLKDVQPSLTQGYIGLIFLIAPLVVVLFSPGLGYLADKYRILNRPFLFIGVFLATFGFLGLGPSPFFTFLPQYSLAVILTSLSIAGVGWAALVITYEEFVNAARVHGFPDSLETQGLVSGVYNSFNNLGAFIGPVAGGFINEQLGFHWSSTITAFMLASTGVIMVIFWVLECCLCPPSKNKHVDVDHEAHENQTSPQDENGDKSNIHIMEQGAEDSNEDSQEYTIRDNDVYKDVLS